MLTNPVLWAVVVMLGLSLARVHVVLSLLIGAIVGGMLSGMPLSDITDAGGEVVKSGILNSFQKGLSGGAEIALSYALLGAFAVAISHSGMPKALINKVVKSINSSDGDKNAKKIKWTLFLALLVMSCFSQNLIPIHIAFIPLLIPPLLLVFNRLQVDRRLLACIMTFGLVNTYMFLPYGFGDIYLNQIIIKNITDAGMNVKNVSIVQTMMIPALGMLTGLLVAMFISYRKPRHYQNLAIDNEKNGQAMHTTVPSYHIWVAIGAILIAFGVRLFTGSLILGALFGFLTFMATGVVKWKDADGVFDQGVKMMAMIGFVMITAQGFAEVMKATGQIEPLVTASADLFAGSKPMAAFAMLFIGLVVTMGIGSSFSTVPIIASIYVPLCITMGFSPMATVALIATSGALGDAGSPASDSTLGPTMGLNTDGQHNHIWDSVVPTFIHYNIPLLIFGWIAAMVL
ncbi:Na+/H+ antiporter family protein [Faucicola mancuniensis]|uniref:Na+/H+ antiporter family protein n=1 Tax=Faucicola mancuniensis TaxID=1309795 RepID=UPI003977435E